MKKTKTENIQNKNTHTLEKEFIWFKAEEKDWLWSRWLLQNDGLWTYWNGPIQTHIFLSSLLSWIWVKSKGAAAQIRVEILIVIENWELEFKSLKLYLILRER